jgi:predicted lipoprotein with Yx(FWY)xxD motif
MPAAPGMPRRRRLTALLAIASALVAACGAPSPAQPRGRIDDATATVRVAQSRFGRILVDSRGRTLYLFTYDRHGRSRCYSACARVWPPATASGRPVAGPGLGAKLTTVRRRDAARQLVYNGHPLYTLIADRRPGQINGQGYSGSWFVLSPAGHQIGHGKAAGGY